MSSSRRIAFLCLSLGTCAAFAAAPTAAPPSGKPAGDTVVATQGTTSVTLADVDAFAQRIDEKQRPGFFNSPKRLEGLISNLLVQKQLAAEARKDGLENDPSVQAQLKLSADEILGKARLEQMKTSLKLPDFNQLAREEYIGHKEKYVTHGKLEVKHILIMSDKRGDAEAQALAEKLQKEAREHPDQFDAMVEQYSEDPSKDQNHGLMTDAAGSRYVPAFGAAASALKIPGEISPVVKTKYGYHILKLITRTSDTPLTYDAVKPQIVDTLRTAYIEKAVGKHSDELRNQHVDANADVISTLRTRYGTSATAPDAGDATPPAAPVPPR